MTHSAQPASSPTPARQPGGTAPDRVVRARAWLCDLPVEQVRTDAVQSFVKQETIFVELETQSGVAGLGYAYTIGTGGGAVLDLLRTTLLETVVGQDVHGPERIWTDAFTITRATTTGAITSLALAALDTAVWDARCRALGLGLWQLAGGFRDRVPVYDTEGGWLHLTEDELVEHAQQSVTDGSAASRSRSASRQPSRTDAAGGRARRRRRRAGHHGRRQPVAHRSRGDPPQPACWSDLDVFWFEEPLPADDIAGHRATRVAHHRSRSPSARACTPPPQFREYLQRGPPASFRSTWPGSAASRRG